MVPHSLEWVDHRSGRARSEANFLRNRWSFRWTSWLPAVAARLQGSRRLRSEDLQRSSSSARFAHIRSCRAFTVVACSKPSVDLVLEVVHQARPTPMEWWTDAGHAPFGQCGSADPEVILRPQQRAAGDLGLKTRRSPWRLRFANAKENDSGVLERQVIQWRDFCRPGPAAGMSEPDAFKKFGIKQKVSPRVLV